MDIINQLSQLLINKEEANETINSLQNVIFNARNTNKLNREISNFKVNEKEAFLDNPVRLVFISYKSEIKFIKINVKDLIFGSMEVIKMANSPLWRLLSVDRKAELNNANYDHIELFENDIVQYTGLRSVNGNQQSYYDGYYTFRGLVKYYGRYFEFPLDRVNLYNDSIIKKIGREKENRSYGCGYETDVKLIGNKYENENLLNEEYIHEKS